MKIQLRQVTYISYFKHEIQTAARYTKVQAVSIKISAQNRFEWLFVLQLISGKPGAAGLKKSLGMTYTPLEVSCTMKPSPYCSDIDTSHSSFGSGADGFGWSEICGWNSCGCQNVGGSRSTKWHQANVCNVLIKREVQQAVNWISCDYLFEVVS